MFCKEQRIIADEEKETGETGEQLHKHKCREARVKEDRHGAQIPDVGDDELVVIDRFLPETKEETAGVTQYDEEPGKHGDSVFAERVD